MKNKAFHEIYAALSIKYGAQNWWPRVAEGAALYLPEFLTRPATQDEAFEIAVGALLAQNTAWTNAVKAIANLKTAEVFDAKSLEELDEAKLAELIRPAGYFNQKSKKIKALLSFLAKEAPDGVLSLAARGTLGARDALLSVWGVGRETADSVLLYALGLPVFVIDAYTRRIFGRLGLLTDPAADYDEIRKLFESALPADVTLYREFHALIVKHGVERCKKKPVCDTCPLARYCTAG